MATTAGTTTNRGYPYPGDASTTNVPATSRPPWSPSTPTSPH